MQKHGPSPGNPRKDKSLALQPNGDPLTMGFGELIRYGRWQRDITMKALGAKIGVCGQTIQNWELGKRKPRARDRKALAKALFKEGSKNYKMILNESTRTKKITRPARTKKEEINQCKEPGMNGSGTSGSDGVLGVPSGP
jgi:transcriptional regulator with XRE-family HTH domain